IFQPKESTTLLTQTQAQACCSGYDCGSCYMGNCGSCMDCTACGTEACAFLSVFAVVLIPIIILIAVLTWVSRKASIRLGGVMRRGALTAIGSSFSIFLIIGSNVGLTEAYHNMLLEQNILMGVSVGLFFGLLIFIALRLSIKVSAIEITPEKITWKDRHTNGTIRFEDIVEFFFEKEQRNTEIPVKSLEDYFILTDDIGETDRIVINCWETPENIYSTDFLESILTYYINKVREQKQAQINTKTLDDDFSENSVSDSEV
ncbi:MAG: hypothetical protein ACTSQ3_04400, partial [Candidatus Heimdallarchaeota archaeon]